MQQEQPICNKISLHQNPFQQDPIATTTTTHLQQNHCNKIHLETTHDTLRDDDAAAAPRVQFNLNDQVFQIFAFLLLAKDPVTLLRSSKK